MPIRKTPQAPAAIMIKSAIEDSIVIASGFAGRTLYVRNNPITYMTAASTANGSVNLSGILDRLLRVGDFLTATLMITNGATPYYVTGVTVDTGTSVTVKWLGGSAPTSGNANSIDVYTFSVVKVSASTFTVFASVAKFA